MKENKLENFGNTITSFLEKMSDKEFAKVAISNFSRKEASNPDISHPPTEKRGSCLASLPRKRDGPHPQEFHSRYSPP